jgi:hypothetical protein
VWAYSLTLYGLENKVEIGLPIIRKATLKTTFFATFLFLYVVKSVVKNVAMNVVLLGEIRIVEVLIEGIKEKLTRDFKSRV